jgi:hypothetical protein
LFENEVDNDDEMPNLQEIEDDDNKDDGETGLTAEEFN